MTLVKEWDTPQGFHCMIVNNVSMGFLCGYVGVPCEHPMYEMNYGQCLQRCPSKPYKVLPEDGTPFRKSRNDLSRMLNEKGQVNWRCSVTEHERIESVIDCHGGVTYADRGVDDMREHLWYIGFDCGHAGDSYEFQDIPEHLKPMPIPFPGDVYRDEVYVENEINSMVEQLTAYTLILSVVDSGHADINDTDMR